MKDASMVAGGFRSKMINLEDSVFLIAQDKSTSSTKGNNNATCPNFFHRHNKSQRNNHEAAKPQPNMILLKAAKTVLHSAWFCSFAQRAWIAFNELGISCEHVESLTIDPHTKVYIKSPELLQRNLKGLVPTLVQTDEQGESFEN
jgi:hypothetical protein